MEGWWLSPVTRSLRVLHVLFCLAISAYLVWIMGQLEIMVPMGWMQETDSRCMLQTCVGIGQYAFRGTLKDDKSTVKTFIL